MPLRFEVPQFIDIKDRIFGPFTFQQFLFTAGGAGMGYIALRVIPTFIRFPIAFGLLCFGLMMAFYTINGRSFPQILQAFFMYAVGSKLYVWRQRPPVVSTSKTSAHTAPIPSPVSTVTNVDDQRLRDLAWNLDILDTRKNRIQ